MDFFPPTKIGVKFLPVDFKFIHCVSEQLALIDILEKLKPSLIG